MSAYLKFYALERSPFDGHAQSQVVLGTKALRDAFSTIRTGLAEGAARICVSGAAGMGKTSLARALPKLVGDEYRVAVVRDPSVPWDTLRSAIARQWGLAESGLPRARLVDVSREQQLVLVIDQAEQASTDFLDHLDVMLCYRDEDERPVVQSVLLANLTSREHVDPPPLIWWLDRIHTLQLEFAPLPRDGVGPYIEKHLQRAGWTGESLFTADACHVLHEFSGGIPGEVGRLCETLLAEAARRDLHQIDGEFVRRVCEAREAIEEPTATDESEQWVVDIGEDATRSLAPEAPEAPEEASWGGSAIFTPSDAKPSLTRGAHFSADQTEEELPEDATEEQAPEPWNDDQGLAGSGAYADASSDVSDASEEVEETGGSVDEEATSTYSLDDLLSRPATAEELRALSGSGFSSYARTVIAIAAAIAIVGIGLGMWLGGETEPKSDEPSLIGLEPEQRPPVREPESEQPAPVLARMRGPVLGDETPPAPPAGTDEEAETEGWPRTETPATPGQPLAPAAPQAAP